MNRFIALMSTLLLSIVAHAQNIAAKQYHFAQNDTIVLPLSSVNTNRLVVQGDKM